MAKRILALILSVVMLFSITVSAYADDPYANRSDTTYSTSGDTAYDVPEDVTTFLPQTPMLVESEPVTASVYTLDSDTKTYSWVEEHGPNAPLDIKNDFNGRTVYVIADAVEQRVYIRCGTLWELGVFGLDFTVSGATGTWKDTDTASNGKTIAGYVSIPAATKPGAEIVVKADGAISHYTLTIKVVDELPGELEELSQNILDALTDLEDDMAEELAGLEGQECRDFYKKMQSAYFQAYYNDELLIPSADLLVLRERFEAMEDVLEEEYGFTDCYEHDYYVYYDEFGNRIEDADVESVSPASYSTRRTSRAVADSADSMGADSEIVTSKHVNYAGGTYNYTLTLEAYVTGQILSTNKPSDVVLVLDQSASMYTPIGLPGALRNDTDEHGVSNYGGTHTYYQDVPANVERYEYVDITAMLKNTTPDSATGETWAEKFAQRGYLIAQSRSGSYKYCTEKNHYDANGKHDETLISCKTYDWFVVQYDLTKKEWNFYRVPSTTTPSKDSQVVIATEEGQEFDKKTQEQEFSDGKYLCTISRAENLWTSKELDNEHFYFYKTQYGALHDSITAVAKQLHDSGLNHRLAVVGFAGEYEYMRYADGSGLYVDGEFKHYNTNEYYCINQYGQVRRDRNRNWEALTGADLIKCAADSQSKSTLQPSDYEGALVDVQTGWESVQKSIKAVTSDYYGTAHFAGMDMANKVLQNNPVTKVPGYDATIGRDQMVIMFTDGMPSTAYQWKWLGNYPDDDAYKNLSDEEKAKEDALRISRMYTDADATTVDLAYQTKHDYNAEVYTIWTATATAENNMMKWASSQYPDAKSNADTVKAGQQTITPGAENAASEKKYAQQTTNADDLMSAFTSIVEIGTTSSELGATTILRDVIDSKFALNVPKDAVPADQIKVYTAQADVKDGKLTFETREELTGASVTVNGKTIDVTGFDYAANYVTPDQNRQDGSNGKKLIVEIPIKYNEEGAPGGTELDTNTGNAGIYTGDKKQHGFDQPKVDIPTTVTIQKEITGAYADRYKDEAFTVNVGYEKFNGYTSYQKDGATKDTDGTASGNYLKANSTDMSNTSPLKKDETATVKQAIIGSVITISEQPDEKYELEGVYVDGEKQTITADGNYKIAVTPNMTIVVKNQRKLRDLKITKAGWKSTDENQTFLFDVKGTDFETTVTIHGNDSVILHDLPADTYTVTEKGNWSWRYDATNYQWGKWNKSETSDGTLSSSDNNKATFQLLDHMRVLVTNERKKDKWLDGNHWINNIFGSSSAVKQLEKASTK